jgi:hypothetical protein
MNVLVRMVASFSILASGASFAQPAPTRAPATLAQAEAIARVADVAAHDVLIALEQRRANYLWFVHRQDRVHAKLRKGLGAERYAEIFGGFEPTAEDEPLRLSARD